MTGTTTFNHKVGSKTRNKNSILAFLKYMDGSVLAFLKCMDGSVLVYLKCMDGYVSTLEGELAGTV